MPDEVFGKRLPEGLRPEGCFEHPQKRAPLGVADGIEDLVDLSGIPHRHLDGMGLCQRIHLEGLVSILALKELPHAPLREERIHRLDLHPGGKAFIQPKVIPPGHGHQVTEPLMGHFMGHHHSHALKVPGRGPFMGGEEGRLPEGHGPPVFHGASGKVGDGQQIQLGQGIRGAEVVVIPGE